MQKPVIVPANITAAKLSQVAVARSEKADCQTVFRVFPASCRFYVRVSPIFRQDEKKAFNKLVTRYPRNG